MSEQTLQQIYCATQACEARIENGADIQNAFHWLAEEISRISGGEEIYDI